MTPKFFVQFGISRRKLRMSEPERYHERIHRLLHECQNGGFGGRCKILQCSLWLILVAATALFVADDCLGRNLLFFRVNYMVTLQSCHLENRGAILCTAATAARSRKRLDKISQGLSRTRRVRVPRRMYAGHQKSKERVHITASADPYPL